MTSTQDARYTEAQRAEFLPGLGKQPGFGAGGALGAVQPGLGIVRGLDRAGRQQLAALSGLRKRRGRGSRLCLLARDFERRLRQRTASPDADAGADAMRRT